MTTTPALNDDLVRLTERHTECIEAIRHIADTLGREGDHDSRVCIRQLSDEFERLFASALETQAERISVLERALEPFAEAGREVHLLGGRNLKISAEHLERARTTLAGAR